MLNEDPRTVGFLSAIGKKSGSNAFARPAITLVANGADSKVNLSRMRFQTGSDAVKSRSQLAQQLDEIGGRKWFWK